MLTVSQLACDSSLARLSAFNFAGLRSDQKVLDFADVVWHKNESLPMPTNASHRFTPCIFLMEASVIFIPCWHIFKNRQLKKETLEIIAAWERKQSGNPSIRSESTRACRRSLASQKESFQSNTSNRRGEMYTMTALEKALETNSTPLLLFSAFKDFSGENIQFLSIIQQWKTNWSSKTARNGLFRKSTPPDLQGEALRRQQFNMAVQIYSGFVSLQYSDYPVNLSSGHYKELEAMFDGTAALCNAHLPNDSVTPFNSYWSSDRPDDVESANNISIVSTVINKSTETFPAMIDSQQVKNATSLNMSNLGIEVPTFVGVPDSFGPNVFNNSEESIKYMVLTNTWPKFVAARCAATAEKGTMFESVKEAVSSWVDRCVQ